MPLIAYSKSTEEFAKSMNGDFLEVKGPPTEKTLKFMTDDEIVAIGGGSVIDTAKIIAMASKSHKVVAIPTTASGAAETSHAVYWENNRKHSVKTPKPEVRVEPELLKTLPKHVIRATSFDALGHALESLWSMKATTVSKILAQEALEKVTGQIMKDYCDLVELIKGGNLAGRAIEITGTNIAHAISYPLTGFYDVPHGFAVGLMLPAVADYVGFKFKIRKLKMTMEKNFDFDFIASAAMGYLQIHNATKDINKDGVLEILRKSL